MKKENIVEKNIKNILSNDENIWYLKDKPEKNSSFESFFKFILENKKRYNVKTKKNSSEQIPYNKSLNHFLLYYSYYPKFPIVSYENNTLIFCSFLDRNFDKIELSIPIYKNPKKITENLCELLYGKSFNKILKAQKITEILIRDIDDKIVNFLKKEENNFKIKSLREINYSVYDIKKSLKMKGSDFSNLRWHLNSFEKDNHKIEEVKLKDSVKPVVHLIGKWRKDAIKKRDFSYVNMRSDKLGARFFGENKKGKNNSNKNIVDFSNTYSSVLKIDGEISSFNLGFPLGIFKKRNVFAHSIGISDLSIPHLAEYAQYHFWKKIKKLGYKYINDGPTWKKDLMKYKDKFRPISKKRYYWAKLGLSKKS